MAKKEKNKSLNKEGGDDFPGYPIYPEDEDIYYQEKEEIEIDPEQTNQLKSADDKLNNLLNEKDFEMDVSGGDLDIPGAELDDVLELVGTEDEENNHYSLGGDDKENNEEDIGENRR